MRRTALLVLGALLLARPCPGSEAADVREGCRGLALGAQVRRGVAHRWMAVVALVTPGSQQISGRALAAAGVPWKPAPSAALPTAVAVGPVAPSPGAEPPANILPSGTVLRHGAEDVVTVGPVLLSSTDPVVVDAVPVSARVRAEPEKAPPKAALAGPGPVELSHVVFLGAGELLVGDLLALDGAALGLRPDQQHVGWATLEPLARERRVPFEAALERLADAYAGEVVGHVVYLGNRPIELVLCPSHATYASFLGATSRSLSLSAVVWEELYGMDRPDVAEPDWDALQKDAALLVKGFADPSLRRVPGVDPRPGSGKAWRVQARLRPNATAAEVGWLLTDDIGRPVLLEAWPECGGLTTKPKSGSGAAAKAGGTPDPGGLPLPPPAPAPGAPARGEGATDVSHGALTLEYLKRLVERLEKLRDMIEKNKHGPPAK